jgi:hypothetical protein
MNTRDFTTWEHENDDDDYFPRAEIYPQPQNDLILKAKKQIDERLPDLLTLALDVFEQVLARNNSASDRIKAASAILRIIETAAKIEAKRNNQKFN